MRVALGLAGVAVVAYLIRDIGVDELREVLVPALPWLPLAALFELGRVAMDAVSSRLTLGRRGHRVPFGPLLASHLVAYAVMSVAPAGRTTSEAVKATLLARWIGAPTAIALGTANQANTLLSSGTFTYLCTAAAYALTGWSVLTQAFLLHSVLLNVVGLAMRAAARYPKLDALFGDRLPKLRQGTASFVEASRETSLFPLGPVLSMMAGRASQTGHFAVLLVAVGARCTVLGALAAHGLYLAIAAIAVLIPGQLGAAEGGFAASHELLSIEPAQALSVALLSHAVQLTITMAGFLVLALWPARTHDADAEASNDGADPLPITSESIPPRD